MCTVVVRWAPGEPVRILALRDELTSRGFDDPGEWWPEHPGVVGGRDRTAGGTWCASRVDTGVTALVLNRPQKRVADAGAPSRGVVPLLGVAHEEKWLDHVDVTGMASFAVVVAGPDGVTSWDFDGHEVTSAQHATGTHMFTSGGVEDGKAERFLESFEAAEFPEGWRALVQREPPQPDLTALVVRHERDGVVYGTVFGQLIEASPGRLSLEYSQNPWIQGTWSALSTD